MPVTSSATRTATAPRIGPKIATLKPAVRSAALAAAGKLSAKQLKKANGILLGTNVPVGQTTIGTKKYDVFFMFNVPLNSSATINPNRADHFYLRSGRQIFLASPAKGTGFSFVNPTN